MAGAGRTGTSAVALAATAALPDGPREDWLALPPGDAPRLLVPRAQLGRAAGAVAGLAPREARVRRTLVGVGLRTLAAGPRVLLPVHDDWSLVGGRLLRRARAVAGMPEAVAVVRLSPHRPNHKPVLQLLDPEDGRVRAYVKIGWNPLTAELVRDERATLGTLPDVAGLRVPTVLGADDGPFPTLAVAPLERDEGSSAADTETLVAHALRLAGTDGLGEGGPSVALAETPLVAGLAAALGDADVDGEPAGVLAARLGRAHGTVPVRLGRWHGDWSPGNVVRTPTGVAAWDWERSTSGAPAGLDAAYALLVDVGVERATDRLAEALTAHPGLHDGPTRATAAALVATAALAALSRHVEAARAGSTTRLAVAARTVREATA